MQINSVQTKTIKRISPLWPDSLYTPKSSIQAAGRDGSDNVHLIASTIVTLNLSTQVPRKLGVRLVAEAKRRVRRYNIAITFRPGHAPQALVIRQVNAESSAVGPLSCQAPNISFVPTPPSEDTGRGSKEPWLSRIEEAPLLPAGDTAASIRDRRNSTQLRPSRIASGFGGHATPNPQAFSSKTNLPMPSANRWRSATRNCPSRRGPISEERHRPRIRA
jgi:hypothetical protein